MSNEDQKLKPDSVSHGTQRTKVLVRVRPRNGWRARQVPSVPADRQSKANPAVEMSNASVPARLGVCLGGDPRGRVMETTATRRVFKAMALMGVVIGIVGLAVVAIVDWRIGLGCFLMIWGNNLEQAARRDE